MYEQNFFPAFLQQAQHCSFSHCTLSECIHRYCALCCFPLTLFPEFPLPTVTAPGQSTAGPSFPLHPFQSALLQLQVAGTGIRFNPPWLGSNAVLCPAKPLTCWCGYSPCSSWHILSLIIHMWGTLWRPTAEKMFPREKNMSSLKKFLSSFSIPNAKGKPKVGGYLYISHYCKP